MLPLDILRNVTSFCYVNEALSLEVALAKTIYNTKHYKDLAYGEEYKRGYTYNGKKLHIESYRICNTLFSLVNSQFIIRHADDISTRDANKKAFEVICDNENSILKRRLKLLGF